MRRKTGGLACPPGGRDVKADQIEMTGRLFDALGTADFSPEAPRFLYLKTFPEAASGSANKRFVVPSELQNLAGVVGAPAGAAMAGEDSKEKVRVIPEENGGA